MKKLVFFIALSVSLVSLVSCGGSSKQATTTDTMPAGMDSVEMVVITDTIIDLTGNWGTMPDTTATIGHKKDAMAHKAALHLNADKTAKAINVPVTKEAVKAKATKKQMGDATPVNATWKKNPATPQTNNNQTLVLFASTPGANQTDSVVYEIVNFTDSTMTIQGEAGVFQLVKQK